MEQTTPYPTGTVTFLFTDIERSTERWERDRVAMAGAIGRHLALVRRAVEDHRGVLFKVVGDAGQAAFPTAPDAVTAALEAQRALLAEDWGAVGGLRVRMALHVGEAEPQNCDYLAPALNRLARLVAAGHGSQVLLTLAAADLARDRQPSNAGLRDLGEHPLRDLYQPERIFQLLHPNLPVDFPPIRTLATRPNNLPGQPTPFVGREEHVARIVEMLSQDDVRLLTITGPGGVGKTRLALQAAADLVDCFPDGVWFADLNALTDASLVIPAIAKSLGVREVEAGLLDRLGAALAQKRVLLVLDNFERLVEAASAIADLLTRVPGLKALVTSRIPVHAYGEREYPHQPFPMPDMTDLPTLDLLNQYEAVRLFITRAQAVKPDFAVTTASAPAVAEICYRLDGLPLAIELAAAYVKVLPPQALLKRLERRLPLLKGGARTLPARQQTMRDAIAWSHDLLTPDEQLVFQRLAVFPGGCTLEGAEAVIGQDGILDVFLGIAALVDKSLLRQEEGIEGEPRFRMLETVREYGLERLEASGEADEVRQRQARWYLLLAELAEPRVIGTSIAPEWIARLDAELPNLRVALDWFLDRGEAAAALRLLAATTDYWTHRFNYAEIDRRSTAALAGAPGAPAIDRFLVHDHLVFIKSMLGEHENAAAHARDALAAAEDAGNAIAMGLAQYDVGMAWEHRGDAERAAEAYGQALPLLQDAGATAFAAWTQADLADKLVWLGKFDESVPMLDEALIRLRMVGPDWGVAMALGQRAYAALYQDDPVLAARFFRASIDAAQSIEAAQKVGSERASLGAVAGLAGVALALGQPERAARLLGATDAARKLIGSGRIAHALHADRVVAAVHDALDEPTFNRAWTAGSALTLDEAFAEAVTLAADLQGTSPERIA